MAESFLGGLKRAFKWHWHLLALGAGAAIALLSGRPDIVLPMVAALELGYLGFLGTNQRFLNVLRGRSIAKERAEAEDESHRKLLDLLQFLSTDDRQRFDRLRDRCVEFDRLRDRLAEGRDNSVVTQLRTDSLQKMLWLFLRLLHHKSAIDHFLDNTDEDRLRKKLESAAADLAKAREDKRSERLVDSLTEQHAAIQERLANYSAAIDSRDLLLAELGKTEQKIEHMNEVGMTSRASDDLSSHIDGIAESMASSERALGDLRSDIFLDDEETPELLGSASLPASPPPIPE
jgi:hypothetical protein